MTDLMAPGVPSLADQIREAVAGGTLSLPALPAVATRVLQLLHDEEADSAPLTELIESDPTIAASVLRVANSAVYSGLNQIADIDQAIARLGARQVGTVVTTVALKGHFATDDPVKRELLQALWNHAVATALAARRLTVAGGGDAVEAFLAGLLHDTGKLLVLRGADHLEQLDRRRPITAVVLDELIDALHVELGHHALSSWKIAEPVCRVALHHHDPNVPARDLLLLRVQAANAIARKLGAHPKPDPGLNLLEVPPIERLNLRDLELASLLVDLEDELARLRRLF